MTKITYIPGEIANAAIDEHGNRKPVTRTHHIFDDAKGKSQAEVNADIDNALTLHQSEINALNSQNYVTVDSFSSLPATGAVDTVYRVSNWDGTQQDPSVYSEYAWNGEDYEHLSTKTQIGEVFDISAYHATGGELAKYADLTAALGTNGANIPEGIRKGGMSVKFVLTSDNKYVQFRYMSSSTAVADFTNVANWQGVDTEITAGSKNIAESGAVATALSDVCNDLSLMIKSSLDITDSITLDKGYIERNGTLTYYATWYYGVIKLKKGYTVNVVSSAINYPALGISNSGDVSIGDTVTVIEGNSYTATNDVWVVISAGPNISVFSVILAGVENVDKEIDNTRKAIKKSYNGGILFGGYNDIEVGSFNNNGVNTANNARWRTKSIVDIPSDNNGKIKIDISTASTLQFWVYWYNSNGGYISETQINSSTELTIPENAVKLRIYGWYISSSTVITSELLFEISNGLDVYFVEFENQNLFSSIQNLNRLSINKNQISDLGYVIMPGYSISGFGNEGNIVFQEDPEWGVLGFIDISGLAETPIIDFYLGDEQSKNRYGYVLRERLNNQNQQQLVSKGENWYEIPFTQTGVDRSKYLFTSVHLTELDKCFIKVRSTGKYLFKPSSLDNTTFPKLHNLRVAEWNVGHWSYGVSPAGADESEYEQLMEETKIILSKINADILFVCEWDDKFDRDDTVWAYLDIFKQFYPYSSINNDDGTYGGTGAVIFSKYPLSSVCKYHIEDRDGSDYYRYYTLGMISVDGVDVKVGCCHLSPTSHEDRVELAGIVASNFTSDKYAIVGGDLNTSSDEWDQSYGLTNADGEEELDEWRDVGFALGNWGYFGRKKTAASGSSMTPIWSVDNIMTKGMNICSFDVLSEKGPSDHFPCISNISFYK